MSRIPNSLFLVLVILFLGSCKEETPQPPAGTASGSGNAAPLADQSPARPAPPKPWAEPGTPDTRPIPIVALWPPEAEIPEQQCEVTFLVMAFRHYIQFGEERFYFSNPALTPYGAVFDFRGTRIADKGDAELADGARKYGATKSVKMTYFRDGDRRRMTVRIVSAEDASLIAERVFEGEGEQYELAYFAGVPELIELIAEIKLAPEERAAIPKRITVDWKAHEELLRVACIDDMPKLWELMIAWYKAAPDQMIPKAIVARESLNWKEPLWDVLLSNLKRAPRRPDPAMIDFLARNRHALGDVETAVQMWRVMMEAYPGLVDPYTRYLNTLNYEVGLPPAAEVRRVIEKLTTLAPADHWAWVVSARAEYQIHQSQQRRRYWGEMTQVEQRIASEAIANRVRYARRAVELHPGSVDALTEVAEALMWIPGNYREAIQMCERALAINPGYDHALYVIQTISGPHYSNEPDRGVELFHKYIGGIQISPSNAESLLVGISSNLSRSVDINTVTFLKSLNGRELVFEHVAELIDKLGAPTTTYMTAVYFNLLHEVRWPTGDYASLRAAYNRHYANVSHNEIQMLDLALSALAAHSGHDGGAKAVAEDLALRFGPTVWGLYAQCTVALIEAREGKVESALNRLKMCDEELTKEEVDLFRVEVLVHGTDAQKQEALALSTERYVRDPDAKTRFSHMKALCANKRYADVESILTGLYSSQKALPTPMVKFWREARTARNLPPEFP